MGMSRVTYNDYQFPDRSNFSVNERFVLDDAGRTIIATDFTLRVETIVCNENPTVSGGSVNYSDPAYDCGSEMHLVRQRLSKVGQSLKIEHDGFGPRTEINGFSYGGIRDAAWGPCPKFISWNPVGHTASCEVVWECTFRVPICDGRTGSPSFTGLAALSYSISYAIDLRGYTTRNISGSIEIAMSRTSGNPRGLTDTADNYRNKVIFPKPSNFLREVTWNLSPDKRRAEFSITDKEISSPNAWPPGVVNIQATHRVSWARSSLARINNTISATIEMAPDQFKARAWLIFRDIVQTRLKFAAAAVASQSGEDGAPQTVFLTSFDVVEEIYENKVSFQLGYYFLNNADLTRIFELTGLFQPTTLVPGAVPSWDSWDQSVKQLQPLRGNGTDRGISELSHDFTREKIIDLCDNVPLAQNVPPTRDPQPPSPPLSYSGSGSTFRNVQPTPYKSWIKFQGYVEMKNEDKSCMSVTLGPNDIQHLRFNPADPTVDGVVITDNPNASSIQRFVEDRAQNQTIIWSGYAERAGFYVPRPGKMKLAGVWLTPVGRGEYRSMFMGMYFGVPRHAASWRQEYKITTIPTKLAPDIPGEEDGGQIKPFLGPDP